MSDQQNLVLAIVLSVLIILGFQFFYELPRLERLEAERAAQAEREAASAGVETPTLDGIDISVAGSAPVGEVLEASDRLPFENAHIHGTINLLGGRIDDLTLIDYHLTVDPASPEIRLLEPAGAPTPYFMQFGWAGAGGDGLALPTNESVWRADRPVLEPGAATTLSWDNGAGVEFRRIFSIDDDYLVTLEREIVNTSDQPITLAPYSLISRWGTPATTGLFILHEGPIGVLEGTLQEIDYSDLQGSPPTEFQTTGGWLGITDKYWLAAMLPDQNVAITANFRHEANGDKYQIDYVGEPIVVQPGESRTVEERIFLGAKEVDLLDRYGEEHNIPLFDRAVDFGWFYFLTKPFFYILTFFNGMFGNYGVAILLLTLLVKIVFFPLANKSYVAMNKMKLLQPEMVKIRERCGDDRQRMNQEMMDLYKKEKVNPMSGCLPILIQIPVFFALYKVLYVSIEMRHAPFFGWIQDLSAPDPTSIFNLFGLIPWDPPQILMLGIWPILMGVTMFAQTKLNPQPADPVQAKVMLALPFLFTFLMASFPAGLVIYWTWNNLLSIAQQWFMLKKHGRAEEKPASS